MGTLSQCCCDCCITPEEMPYASVTLTAPYDDCGGPSIGIDPPTPSYPTENFERRGCCYVAEFPFSCQPWSTEFCSLWAKQSSSISYSVDNYFTQSDYIDDASDPFCPCVKTHVLNFERNATTRVFFVERHRLTKVTITVGKAAVRCSGESESVCRFFIAATYEFNGQIDTAPSIYTDQLTTCTGVYRNRRCSSTYTEASDFGIDSDSCPFDNNYFTDFATSPDPYAISFSRIKFYDVLPADAADILATDTLPASCCEGETSCDADSLPCGLSVGSNCYQFTISDEDLGTLLPDFAACSRVTDGLTETVCPTVEEKDGVTISTQAYRLDTETGCYTTVYGDNAYVCFQDYPGVDRLLCYTYIDDNGQEVKVYINEGFFNLGCVANFEDGFCTVEGCESTGGLCFAFFQGGGGMELIGCPDLTIDPGHLCRRDIYDLTCDVSLIEITPPASVCFTLPTASMEFA